MSGGFKQVWYVLRHKTGMVVIVKNKQTMHSSRLSSQLVTLAFLCKTSEASQKLCHILGCVASAPAQRWVMVHVRRNV